MPPQDRPNRVAGESCPPCGSYRGLPGLSQAFPDDLLKVASFHCGIDTTTPRATARRSGRPGARRPSTY